MDFLFLLQIKDAFTRLQAYLLKKFGKKIVNLDNYREEEVDVKSKYSDISPKCIAEKNNGARKCNIKSVITMRSWHS